jgi:Glycosyltransferase family 92
VQIYDICIHEFRHRHAWMGFIDADEFLLLRNRSLPLPSFLQVMATPCKPAVSDTVRTCHVVKRRAGAVRHGDCQRSSAQPVQVLTVVP